MHAAVVMSEPDGRVLSAMDDDTKLVHAYLEEWARYLRNQYNELGFPADTYLKRWITFGIDGAQQKGKPPTMPDRIAITDAAVASLGDIDGRVIREFYGNWAPREIHARRVRMRVRQWDAVLKRARWRVGAFIQGANARV